MPLISIIVPVYKAEAYLERCVNSILSQTFCSWELLLVDDGSPDRSGAICDSFTLKDKRIHAYHKENGGVASAREFGVQKAKGEYSIHVDPDDWIDTDMLESMYDEAIEYEADMVVCDFMMEYKNRSFIDTQKPVSLDPSLFLCQMIRMERHGSLCNKLIRTRLYHELDLHFPIGMNCWEDLYICVCLLHSGCRVAYINRPFYHYDFSSNDNSMVRNTNIVGLKAQINCVRLIENLLGCKDNELNEMKGLVLVTAFRLQLLSAEKIRDLYPEINSWYIKKYRNKWKQTNYYGLSALLSGHSFAMVRIMMFCSRQLYRVLRIIRIEKSE